MANSDKATGFRPVRTLDGKPFTGNAMMYYIPSTDSTAVYVGDPVKLAGSADADGVPTVTKASSTNAIVGIVTSVKPITAQSTTYREASVSRYVYVCVDDQMLYEIQEDSVGGALAVTDVGNNANWVDGGGSTVTGLSGIELDSSTKATTATLDMQIVQAVVRPNNEIGTNAKWLVKLNNYQYVDGTTGV